MCFATRVLSYYLEYPPFVILGMVEIESLSSAVLKCYVDAVCGPIPNHPSAYSKPVRKSDKSDKLAHHSHTRNLAEGIHLRFLTRTCSGCRRYRRPLSFEPATFLTPTAAISYCMVLDS